MKCLLDTCVLLWLLDDASDLSETVKRTIFNRRNEVFVSTVSFWEISLKHSLGKLPIEGIDLVDLEDAVEQMRIGIIGLNEGESSTFYKLPNKENHKDPFDRMLIWQAISRDMTLLSKDVHFEQYTADGLKLFW